MSAKFCSSCGAALAPGVAFCGSCGARVDTGGGPANVAPPAAAPVPPPLVPAAPQAAPVPVAGTMPPPPPASGAGSGRVLLFALIAALLVGAVVVYFVFFHENGRSSGGTAAPLDVSVNPSSGGLTTSHGGYALVGRWSRQPDCTRTLEFRSDGTMSNPSGDTGSWTIGPGANGNTLLTMRGGGATLRAHLGSAEGGGIQVLPLDGTPSFVLHRC